MLYVENGRIVFGLNSYGIYNSVTTEPLAAGVRRITVRATVRPRLRSDHVIEIDGLTGPQLLDQVQLVGMSPRTGISVGVDARGPASWDLRERRDAFRYTGGLRAITYTPGPIRTARAAPPARMRAVAGQRTPGAPADHRGGRARGGVRR